MTHMKYISAAGFMGDEIYLFSKNINHDEFAALNLLTADIIIGAGFVNMK